MIKPFLILDGIVIILKENRVTKTDEDRTFESKRELSIRPWESQSAKKGYAMMNRQNLSFSGEFIFSCWGSDHHLSS